VVLIPPLEKFTLHVYLTGKRPEMLNKLYILGVLQINQPSKLDSSILIGINAVEIR
jgi:hypothetical protein